MTAKQRLLNRSVSRVTGESLAVVSRRGFVPLRSVPFEIEPGDPDLEELILDWDDIDDKRNVPVVRQRQRAVA